MKERGERERERREREREREGEREKREGERGDRCQIGTRVVFATFGESCDQCGPCFSCSIFSSMIEGREG
jgi:hypothetical protein